MRPLLVLLAFATVADAAPRPRCERGFDYWIGEWDVRPHGKPGPVSENHITSEQGGCVIQERWRSAPDGPGAGYTGTSFTIFDRPRAVWHQTWVDNGGGLAVFEGRLDPRGDLVLERVPLPGDPDRTRRRMSYRKQPGGGVRQMVERSTDGGATWVVTIDLDYLRRVVK